MAKTVTIPIVPPAVVGWDASPRGEQNSHLEEVAGICPYTPIVIDATPGKFRDMLKESIKFVNDNVTRNERYAIINAWNEIGHCCALLPQLTDNDYVDKSYLNAVKTVKKHANKQH